MKKALVFLGFSAFMIACNQQQGKANLAIGTPTDNSTFILPASFNVDASLLEGVINQYKIQLTLASPCEAIDSASVQNFDNFSYLFVSNQSYNQSILSHNVQLPADFTPGYYMCVVSCIVDQNTEGKDTTFVYVKNTLDTIRPTAAISEPSGNVTINKGDTLRIMGLVDEKRTGLIQGEMYRIKVTMEANFSGQAPLTVTNQSPPSDPNDSLKVKYKIPSSIVSGGYTLKIMLLDEFNNFTIYTYQVQVN